MCVHSFVWVNMQRFLLLYIPSCQKHTGIRGTGLLPLALCVLGIWTQVLKLRSVTSFSIDRLDRPVHHWGRATCCAASHPSPLMWHCLPPAWGWTGSPRFSGVNCKLWIWRVSAKRLFWQLHISTSRNLAWLGMGFPLYKHRFYY